MTIDGILTFIGILFAAWAIIPKIKKLQLSINTNKFISLSIILSVCAILYLQYYTFFESIGWALHIGIEYKWGISPNKMSFLVLFIPIGCALYLINNNSYSKKNILKIKNYIIETRKENDTGLACKLIEDNLEHIVESSENHENEYKPPADFILYDFLQERDALSYLVKYNYMLAILIQSYFKRFSFNFSESFHVEALSNKESFLYKEVFSKYQSSMYYIFNDDSYLNFILTNVDVANKLGVYKPIGDFLIDHLDDIYQKEESKRYDRQLRSDDVNKLKDSEIYIVIAFFDLLIKNSIRQGYNDHMWLLYYGYFSERIIRNIGEPILIPKNSSEWQSTYHFFIEEMINNIINWIKLCESSSDFNKLDCTEEVNIEKFSIDTLCAILKQVIHEHNEKIDSKMKVCFTESVFELVIFLRTKNSRYSKYLENALLNDIYGKKDTRSIEFYSTAIDDFDLPKYEYKDWEYLKKLIS
ncbi:hypothetical protein ACLMPP_03795 [Yersinia enterocolitica]|uniref:hypothetical protein n=1 Tax=Yersinia enterocolitica TaxID=630 RepID=UPI00398D0965